MTTHASPIRSRNPVRTGAALLTTLTKLGVHTWNLGEIQDAPTGAALADYVQGAKGVDGGAVRLVGEYK